MNCFIRPKAKCSRDFVKQNSTGLAVTVSVVRVVKKLAAACTGFNPISCCPPCFSDFEKMPMGIMFCRGERVGVRARGMMKPSAEISMHA